MSDKRSNRRVVCRHCHALTTRNNIRAHYARKDHPDIPATESTLALYDEVGGALVPVASSAVAKAEPPTALPPLGIDDLDGLVLGVVDQLADASGSIPVAHLAAVFAWREATAVFLRAVTQ